MCLVLYTDQESTTILLIAHFDGVDPASNDPNGQIVFSQLSRFDLLNNLLSIYPAAPVGGRRNIRVESSSTSKDFSSNINHYLVLKSVKVPTDSKWPIPIDEHVAFDEMMFILEVVNSLITEEHKKLALHDFQMTPNDIKNDNVANDDNESTDSYPVTRSFLFEFIEKDHSDKSFQIEQWLNNSNSSFHMVSDINND